MERENAKERRIRRDDRCANRDRAIERGSVLKRSIEKIVELSSENPVGEPCDECKTTPANTDA